MFSANDTFGENSLLCWGCGEFGQHGHDKMEDVPSTEATLEEFNEEVYGKVKFVACGSCHTVVITVSNDIFTFGNGNSGQLGNGMKSTMLTPKQIFLDSDETRNIAIQGVSCGARHTFIWLENGQMFSFGNNFFAQLGYDFRIKNYKENQMKPHLLQTLTHLRVTKVDCGEKHSMLLFEDGKVAVLGNGSLGQIGNNKRAEAVVPVFLEDLPPCKAIGCGSFHCLAIDVNGSVWMWGYGRAFGKKADILEPVEWRKKTKNIKKVAGGKFHSMALTENGNVYTWGVGTDGQLGHRRELSKNTSRPQKVKDDQIQGKVADIGCTENYSTAITVDGELFIWGKNNNLIHSNGSHMNQTYTPIRVNLGGTTVRTTSTGIWHMAAISGKPEWESCKDDDSSEDEDNRYETDYRMARERDSEEVEIELDLPLLPEKTLSSKPKKEKTTLAEFYAPTPDLGTISASTKSPDCLESRPRTNRSARLRHDIHHKYEEFTSNGKENDETLKLCETCNIIFDKSESHQCKISVDSNDLNPPKTCNSPDLGGTIVEENSDTDNDIWIPMGEHQKKLSTDIKKVYQYAKKPTPVLLQRGTVQVSGQCANGFVLPRDKTTLHNMKIDFVAAENINPHLRGIQMIKDIPEKEHNGIDSIDKKNATAPYKPLMLPNGTAPKKMTLHSYHGRQGQRGPLNHQIASKNVLIMRRSPTHVRLPIKVKQGVGSTAGNTNGIRSIENANTSKLEDIHARRNKESEQHLSMVPHMERSLMVPKTVTFVAKDENIPVVPIKNVSIPNKLLQRSRTDMGMIADIPRNKATYSSGTSWKGGANKGMLRQKEQEIPAGLDSRNTSKKKTNSGRGNSSKQKRTPSYPSLNGSVKSYNGTSSKEHSALPRHSPSSKSESTMTAATENEDNQDDAISIGQSSVSTTTYKKIKSGKSELT